MTFPAKTPPRGDASKKRSLGKGVFRKCKGCRAVFTAEQLAEHWEICTSCGHHHPLSIDGWRKLLLDDGALEPWDDHLRTDDPLSFSDGKPYVDRLEASRAKTGHSEAFEAGRGRIEGIGVGWGCFVFGFMGGSMGSVAGERIARLFERAGTERLPVVLLHASGGARMQEGILSLMQMAKTVSALERFRGSGRPFLSVALHPTTGGVAASTALLGDVNLAEPGALVGFAGPRVIESTLGTKLPPGFQRSEFLLDHGMTDCIVPRTRLRQTLANLLRHLANEAT